MIGNGQSIFVQKDFPHLICNVLLQEERTKKEITSSLKNMNFFSDYPHLIVDLS